MSQQIKDYLAENLVLNYQMDSEGDWWICLVLEGKVISKLPFTTD